MPRSAPSPAVILLSGGLDSATALAVARARGHACHALTFDYGQRHRHELTAARSIAAHQNVASHLIERLDLRLFGGSALTADIPVPKDRDDAAIAHGIPITYVPARNLIFLSLAAAFAEVIGAQDLYIGVNAVDYSGYPDCRPEFIKSFERTARLATRAGVEGAALTVHTPLMHLSKPDIIRLGISLGVDYSRTHSCYDPDPSGAPCGHCDSCLIRSRGFRDAGLPDPARR
ncbi:MAG: 7-cyano-7-deazaguanine synthase QueC [Phycisphaerae bacterium]|nr:7-cyano-7-deazaguanine synthase QueC [Phycisphaerae bacterium]